MVAPRIIGTDFVVTAVDDLMQVRTLLLALAWVLAFSRPSLADTCVDVFRCPSSVLVPGPNAVVPANLPAMGLTIADHGEEGSSSASTVRVGVRGPEGRRIGVDRQGANFVFEEALAPNATYVVDFVWSDREFCSSSGSYEFSTVEAAPLPEALGEVIEVEVQSAPLAAKLSCEAPDPPPLVRELALRLHPTARLWRQALMPRLFVDGRPSSSPESSFQFSNNLARDFADGRFDWELAIACDGAEGRAPAERVVQVGARIPGLWGGKTEARGEDLGCGGCQAVPPEFSTVLLLLMGARVLVRRRRVP